MAGKPNPKDWEIPQGSAVPSRDPWAAPGQRTRSAAPLACVRCGISVQILSAFAKDGDLYCTPCRPAGAVGGADLPSDPMLDRGTERRRVTQRLRAASLLQASDVVGDLLSVVLSVFTRR